MLNGIAGGITLGTNDCVVISIVVGILDRKIEGITHNTIYDLVADIAADTLDGRSDATIEGVNNLNNPARNPNLYQVPKDLYHHHPIFCSGAVDQTKSSFRNINRDPFNNEYCYCE